jgi:methionyl-tRNA formyltransferase
MIGRFGLTHTPRGTGVAGLPVVFFGMRCAFSQPPLRALLAAGVDLRAVVVPGPAIGPPVTRQRPGKRLPLAGMETTIDDLVAGAGVPLFAIREPGHPEVVAAIRELAPAVIVLACFPWLLPRAVRELPPLGCLNVHPSLLPIGRGPDPLFWTFRRGEERTGVTIHQLTGRFDAGPIVRQQAIAVPDGIRAPDLEQRLAEMGGTLLVAALGDLIAGPPLLRLRMQDEREATSAPFPADEDFTVPTDRSARWAFNFVRGIAPLGHSLTLVVNASGERWPIRDALAWEPAGTLAQSVIVREDEIVARFRPGIVRFRRR